MSSSFSIVNPMAIAETGAMATVHIIGAGVSGLAAATLLAENRVPVKLYEATASAGGRARSSNDAALGAVDHGLHLIGGDARELLQYLKRIHAQEGLREVANPVRFPKAPLADYAELAGALTKNETLRLSDDNILHDAWARRFARLFLHTKPEQLSAAALRRALVRWLRHYPKSAKQYVARDSLGETFVAPALTHLEYHGASVYFSHALKSLGRDGDTLTQLHFARKKIALDAQDVVILATPPAFTQSLLPDVPVPEGSHSAITLHFDIAHREAANSLYAPANAPIDLVRFAAGRISATLRVADHAWNGDAALLAHRVWKWLQAHYPSLKTHPLPPFATWREKRAGHLLTASAQPPMPPLPPRLLLAGDWLDACEPASLESAARSGHRAAEAVLALVGPYPARRQ
jgi:hypothetical protein